MIEHVGTSHGSHRRLGQVFGLTYQETQCTEWRVPPSLSKL